MAKRKHYISIDQRANHALERSRPYQLTGDPNACPEFVRMMQMRIQLMRFLGNHYNLN